MYALRQQGIEIPCPNSSCYSTLRSTYEQAFNWGEMTCSSCGARVKLDYSQKDRLRRVVEDLEWAQQALDNAMDSLLDGADITTQVKSW